MKFVKIYSINKRNDMASAQVVSCENYPTQLLKKQTRTHIPYVSYTEQQQIPKFTFNPEELILHPYDQFLVNANNVVKNWDF